MGTCGRYEEDDSSGNLSILIPQIVPPSSSLRKQDKKFIHQRPRTCGGFSPHVPCFHLQPSVPDRKNVTLISLSVLYSQLDDELVNLNQDFVFFPREFVMCTLQWMTLCWFLKKKEKQKKNKNRFRVSKQFLYDILNLFYLF